MKTKFLYLILFISPLALVAQDRVIVDEVIGIVGSEILLKSDLEKQVLQYKVQGMPVNDAMQCTILEDLLFQKLLINQAKLDSIEVTDQQVEGELDRRIKYFVSQIGSEEALEQYYKKSMEEIREELRETLAEQLVIQRMQSEVTAGTDITPSEVKKYYNELPEDSLPYINTQVEIEQIVILAPANRQEEEAARQKLDELRKRIMDGEDFATLAILYSEDPGTSNKGGELGFVGKAEVDPAFAETAFKLKGKEVSRIVKSEFGLHIIQLIEKKGNKVNVRHILIKPKIQGPEILRAKEICDSLKRVIESTDSITFSLAAIRHSDDEESKNSGGLMVNPYSGDSKFELDQLDPSVYLAIENLKPGELSEPAVYSTRDGKKGYALYYLLKKQEAHKANLKMDYQQIHEAALAAKSEEAAKRWIEAKLKTTYSKVQGRYQKCNFEHNWDKVN